MRLTFSLALPLLCGLHALAAQAALPSFTQPNPSPDGSEIAFVTSGDIWVVPAGGGVATLLVSHEATEGSPRFSPDGARLAFTSDRAGDNNIYVMTLATGDVTRLTYGDGNEELDGWSPDGNWVYFADGRQDPGGHPDIWRIGVGGGTPMPVLADRYSPEFHAAVAPDGHTIAIAANARMAQSQWWRNGHSHIDESEIWLVTPGGPPAYRQLSESGSKNVWPMWSGSDVVYVSDRSGSENLWVQPAAGGSARALTSFTDGRLLFPSITPDGRLVTFERDFGIWTMQLPDGPPVPVAITLRGARQRTAAEHLSLNDDFEDLALSPDGKKVAFTVRGEVFATAAGDGGPATRVTTSLAAEEGISWAPDSRRIAYTSRRFGNPKLFLYDFGSNQERQLTRGAGVDMTPRFSPDGSRVAYARDGREIRVVDLESGADTQVATGRLWRYPFGLDRPLVWSPDGEWIAFFSADDRTFTNVWLVPTAGGDAHRVSGLANTSANSIAWSPDGETIYFDTHQRTQTDQIASVDLVPRTPMFREDRFTALFEPPTEPEGGGDRRTSVGSAAEDTSLAPVFADIRRRLSLLPIGVDVGTIALSPDGKTLVFTGSAEGRENLYAFSVDRAETGQRVTRQVTSSAGGKDRPQFTPDGDEVYYLERGRIQIANLESGRTRTLAVNAELDVEFDRLKVEAFEEGWTYLRDHFYDDQFHGADWDDVRRRFDPYIRGATTRMQYSRLMNMMLGELNSSHLGHFVQGNTGPTHGVLGLRFDRTEYEEGGRLRITEVLPLGPAAVAGGITVGDYLLTVKGEAMGAGVNLDRVLENTRGDRVLVTVSSSASGSDAHEVAVQPITMGNERQLAYRDWVETNRAYVEERSGGRLGYVHMASMSFGSLMQLYKDLDAENHDKEGVVVDIRNNNGGFVNSYALDVFARRGYITMQLRGYPEANARSILGQRSLERGTVLVVNQHTLSDGEDFTEGYRALGLGQVVGVPTAGWIIYTWGLQLVDGSNLRMPRSKIRGADGEVMERNPRPVDVEVVRPMGESYSGRDSQLDAAVEVLLGGR